MFGCDDGACARFVTTARKVLETKTSGEGQMDLDIVFVRTKQSTRCFVTNSSPFIFAAICLPHLCWEQEGTRTKPNDLLRRNQAAFPDEQPERGQPTTTSMTAKREGITLSEAESVAASYVRPSASKDTHSLCLFLFLSAKVLCHYHH